MGSSLAAACAAAGAKVSVYRARPSSGGDLMERVLAAGRTEDRAAIRGNVRVGSLGMENGALADADWICECVVENLDNKREVLARIEAARGERSVVSTMSSGLTLSSLTRGLPARLRRDLFATHFFNPLRVMRGVEVAWSPGASPARRDALVAFCRERLGKGVVYAKDSPNFIANRIGVFMMLAGLHKAKPYLASGHSPEWVDAVVSAPFGLPAMGLYGLIDLLGLDIGNRIALNLEGLLPAGDPCLAFTRYPPLEQAMLDRGQVGRGSGGGFYRIATPPGGAKRREVFDLTTGEWRAAVRVRLAPPHDAAATLMFDDSPEGRLAWDLMGATLLYAASLVPEVAEDLVNVDRAMRWCFGWARGPFELLDSIGPRRIAARVLANGGRLPVMLDVLGRSGAESFYRDRGFLGVGGGWHRVPDDAAMAVAA